MARYRPSVYKSGGNLGQTQIFGAMTPRIWGPHSWGHGPQGCLRINAVADFS